MSDNLKYRGEPDRSLLNRNEAWEVDYFVTYFAAKHSSSAAQAAAIAEKARRLLKVVPTNLRSHDHITQWLEQNWGKYQ